MKTLWEEHNVKSGQTGWVNPTIISVPFFMNPEVVLTQAGYTKNGTKGWTKIKSFKHGVRFHAYINDKREIELHQDTDVLNKQGELRHIASPCKSKKEKNLFRDIISLKPPKSTVKKVKYKTETLSLERQREAMKLLKLQRENVWQKIKRFICG